MPLEILLAGASSLVASIPPSLHQVVKLQPVIQRELEFLEFPATWSGHPHSVEHTVRLPLSHRPWAHPEVGGCPFPIQQARENGTTDHSAPRSPCIVGLLHRRRARSLPVFPWPAWASEWLTGSYRLGAHGARPSSQVSWISSGLSSSRGPIIVSPPPVPSPFSPFESEPARLSTFVICLTVNPAFSR